MSASDYLDAAADARATIEEDGAPMTLQWIIPGVRDNVAGTSTPDIPMSKDIFGLIEDALAAAKYFVGTTIQTGDAKVTIPVYADIDLALNNNYRLLINGVLWKVKTIGMIAPGGVPIMYPLHVGN